MTYVVLEYWPWELQSLYWSYLWVNAEDCPTRICLTHCCWVTQSCSTLCSPMDCSTPGFPVLHYLQEFAQIHVHLVDDAIQPSHHLSPPSPPALPLSKPQCVFHLRGNSSKSWRRQWHPTPVLLPGKSHGQRSLMGCSPWGHRIGHDLAIKEPWQQ